MSADAMPRGAAAEAANPAAKVSECTFVELALHLQERAEHRRLSVPQGATARELSVCISSLEEAINRHNRAVYREQGRFAVSDAERLP